MLTCSGDMAGWAAGLGLFSVLPALHLPLEIHGIFLAVENMPSGQACRPGDIVKAMNGTMIEILNTDAEGRVCLADSLVYAERLEPDAIIDLATLTGACTVALGDEIAGLLGNDARLIERLRKAGSISGDLVWELPLFHPYDDCLRSKVGDVKNISGGRSGGVITASLFLARFIEKTPWAHLDIAGPAFFEKETRPDIGIGGTGFGVRLLARYLQGLS